MLALAVFAFQIREKFRKKRRFCLTWYCVTFFFLRFGSPQLENTARPEVDALFFTNGTTQSSV